MIRNTNSKSKFLYAFLFALTLHVAVLAYVKKGSRNLFKQARGHQVKLEQIKFIPPEEVLKYKKVGIKDGKKNLLRPDLIPPPSLPAAPQAPRQKSTPQFSLEKLAPSPPPSKVTNEDSPNFYFNYKENRTIPPNEEQELLKSKAAQAFPIPSNKATERISNFEIRYERPEGVSEDELNSDEKAYYSFYVRSYQNYFSKIYSNYEKILVQKPGLSRVFDKKHLLIGKIDYDVNGNIIMVKILKSSDSDDLHYFFEETLKQLNQPNPPKIFTKNRKQFSIYYQLQIN